ncbi:MAG: hypothetical protein Q7U36_03645 [bacterium]|nr:hypothetical protein [bacterium]
MKNSNANNLIEQGKLNGIQEIENLLGHEVVKLYNPSYQLLDAMSTNMELPEKMRFMLEIIQSAIACGIAYTPSKAVLQIISTDMDKLVGLAWQSFILKDVLGGNFTEPLDNYSNKIQRLWNTPKNLIGISKNGFREYIDSVQPILQVRLVQLLLGLLSISLSRFFLPKIENGGYGFRIFKIIDLLSELNRDIPINLLVSSPSASNDQLVLEISSPEKKSDCEKDWYWRFDTPHTLDIVCQLLYQHLGKPYAREKVLTHRSENSRFFIRCELDFAT